MNPWIEKLHDGDMEKRKLSNRSGMRLRFESGVDPELREALLRFAKWLRTVYEFPIRVPVYIKNRDFIVAVDKDLVAGTFFGPYDKTQEPYIKIAAGEFTKERKRINHRELVYNYFAVLAHELTHYYQWLGDQTLTARGEEWQASFYGNNVVYEYIEATNDAEAYV